MRRSKFPELSIMKATLAVLALAGVSIYLTACPGMPGPAIMVTDSTTASEIAEAVVSGAVNVSYSGGAQARMPVIKPSGLLAGFKGVWSEINPLPEAEAQRIATTTCPTLQASSTNCAVSGNAMTLTYPVCNFANTTYTTPSSQTTWSGAMIITHTAGPTTLACGGFPAFTSGDTITRTFQYGTSRVVDLLPSGVLDILVDTSPPTATGTTITYSGAVARTITVNSVHVAASVDQYVVWNYLVTSGALTVDATNTVSPSGGQTVTLQDIMHSGRTATATLDALTYSANCCMPTGGSVSTTWNDGTPAENLVFSSTCGQATLNGNPITLTECF